MFINNFKTNLNVFVFTEEFQIEKVFTIPLQESFIYWQENMTAIWSVGHQTFSHCRASDISRGRGPAKFRYFREIPRNSQKNAKSTRNISKYISAKHI